MTKIVFSLDTEDYINPHAADGIIRASKIIRDAGYIPCHNVVARLAEALEKWGRNDVIDEIKSCEISSHSLKHTCHPTICEYTDIEDYTKAMEIFRREEDECLSTLKRVFGERRIPAACPPGASCSYVAHYGYADMGIPIYDGGFTVDAVKNRPVSFCNIMVLEYNNSFDNFGNETKENILALIEKMASKEIWVFYHHPAKNTIPDFTDEFNFNGKNYAGDPYLSPMRSDEEIARFEDNLKFFLETIKNDTRFEVVNYSDIADEYAEERILSLSDIHTVKAALDEDFFPVTTPMSLSLSDIMLACRDFLLGKESHKCLKVYGFMSTPYSLNTELTLTKEELVASCNQIKDNEFLPAEIIVGGKKIGPADWLRATLKVLCGESEAHISPANWQIDLDEFPTLRDQCFKGTWMHSPDLEDKYLSDRARLQSWTIRLPRDSKRRIY